VTLVTRNKDDPDETQKVRFFLAYGAVFYIKKIGIKTFMLVMMIMDVTMPCHDHTVTDDSVPLNHILKKITTALYNPMITALYDAVRVLYSRGRWAPPLSWSIMAWQWQIPLFLPCVSVCFF
jgi:hypothetical protein